MKNYKNNSSSIHCIVSLLSMACLSLSLLSAPSYAEKTANSFKANNAVIKKMKVRNVGELDRGLNLARGGNHSAIVLTCYPPTDSWCANEFQTACEKGGGGLSTEPDGGISCSGETE